MEAAMAGIAIAKAMILNMWEGFGTPVNQKSIIFRSNSKWVKKDMNR